MRISRRLDVDVCGLTLGTARRLVDHGPGIGQTISRLPGAPPPSKNAPMDAAWPMHMVLTSGLDELHGVVYRQPRRYRPTG